MIELTIMTPPEMMAPAKMMTRPRFSGRAHSACQVGMVEVTCHLRQLYPDRDVSDEYLPFRFQRHRQLCRYRSLHSR